MYGKIDHNHFHRHDGGRCVCVCVGGGGVGTIEEQRSIMVEIPLRPSVDMALELHHACERRVKKSKSKV